MIGELLPQIAQITPIFYRTDLKIIYENLCDLWLKKSVTKILNQNLLERLRNASP